MRVETTIIGDTIRASLHDGEAAIAFYDMPRRFVDRFPRPATGKARQELIGEVVKRDPRRRDEAQAAVDAWHFKPDALTPAPSA